MPILKKSNNITNVKPNYNQYYSLQQYGEIQRSYLKVGLQESLQRGSKLQHEKLYRTLQHWVEGQMLCALCSQGRRAPGQGASKAQLERGGRRCQICSS